MAGDERGEVRRRTSFEKDLRGFVLKIVLGVIVGVVLGLWSDAESWWGPMFVGVLAVFFLASCIRGSERHAD